MSTFCNYWNKVSLVKSKIKKSKKIDSIGIGLASPEEIRRWGERRLPNGTLIGKVDKDHTVDYESLKPIEGGLFCERIFGPVEDFYCSCERKGEKNEKFCPNCEVEFTKSRVRRIRMGYIPLAVPVVHVWYLRGRPSYIANLVGKSRNSIDRLAYGETLSESFIGYSSLESIYKKEEDFFPKRIQRILAQLRTPQRSNASMLTPCFAKELRRDYANAKDGRVAHTLYTPSNAYLRDPKVCEAELVKALPFAKRCVTSNQYTNQREFLQNDAFFSSSLSLMANQDFTLPKKLNYPKGRIPSNANNCVIYSCNSMRNNRSLPLRGYEGITKLLCRTNQRFLRIVPTKWHPFAIAKRNLFGFTSSGLEELAKQRRVCIAEKSGAKILHSKVFGSTAYPFAKHGVKEQKYFKCHTLPLFSTFVYKEWSHRFSFLEYFIWSARNNDLVLPFYAYQNSRSERRLANICESIRKSSINLIKNKFSLRFSNKSNFNHSFTSNEAPGSLVFQKQKIRPHFLQLRNKQSALRFIKVNKDIDFLFYTKPNSSDMRIPHTNLPTNFRFVPSMRLLRLPLRGMGGTAKDVKASDLAQPIPDKSSDKSPTLRYLNPLQTENVYGNEIYGLAPCKGLRRGSPHATPPTNLLTNLPNPPCEASPGSIKDWSGNEMFASPTPYKSKICKGYGLATLTPRAKQAQVQYKYKSPICQKICKKIGMGMKCVGSLPSMCVGSKATCTYVTHTPQGVSYSKSKPLLLQRCISSLHQKDWDFSEALELKISLRPRGAQITTINSCNNREIPFRYHNYSAHALIRYHNNLVIPYSKSKLNPLNPFNAALVQLARVKNDKLAQRESLTHTPSNAMLGQCQAKKLGKNNEVPNPFAEHGVRIPQTNLLTNLPNPPCEASPGSIKDWSGNEMFASLTPTGYGLATLTPRAKQAQAQYKYKSPICQKLCKKIGMGMKCVSSLPSMPLLRLPHTNRRFVRGMGGKAVLTNCGNERVNNVNEGSTVSEFDAPLYAFSTMQQDAESTPLNKMDTQQFPRLTELLNFTGGAALRNLLSRFDLIVLSRFLRHELKNLELKVNSLLALKMLTYSQGLLLGKLAKRRSKQIRRLKLLELFQSQKSNPEWMILSVIPVLPPDLRPILRVNDDFVVASDLNRLYQTVLRRNNTIHERLDDPLPCPESGLFRQRSLQKAVDGLLENGKGGGTPLCASKRRPLVSLSHVLKGKKGLFRQHLLGKRVDYSGRSVIVVGPRLQLHECGLPKEMAIELFQPFLLHRLKVKGLASSNTTARRMIQQGNPVIWHLLKQLVYEHPVLLNRAPTLHRLGIQAFQPRLVSGRAILLHPLVCNGFNADFDGDQMAVHVPLSFQARAEAWKIMWSKNNFLSPATGQPILVPSQDMVLGCYYLSVSIPRILNANVNNVSHNKAMTNGSFTSAMLKEYRRYASNFTNLNGTQLRKPMLRKGVKVAQRLTSNELTHFLQIKDLYNTIPIPCKGKEFIPSNAYPFGACEAELVKALLRADAALPKVQNKVLHSKAFLNENKGQYFSNLQDSLLAYFQGRLQTHTPFWVRIDNRSRHFATSCNSTKIFSEMNSQGTPKELQRSCVNELCCTNQRFVRIVSTKCESRRDRQQSVNSQIQHSAMNDKLAKRKNPTHTPDKSSSLNPLAKQGNEMFASLTPTGYGLATCKGLRSNHNAQYVSPMNKPNIDNYTPLNASKAYPFGVTELTFLQPLYGSSREICKTLFQNKNTNNSDARLIRVEANETLESPLELRLSVDGNLANILTMFQNHYNYNATWIKQCKEESIKYMRTTAGRVVINDAVFRDF